MNKENGPVMKQGRFFMRLASFLTGDFRSRHVFKDMNNYFFTGAEMIDPDMRFNPRGHIFLLPVCIVKTDFADARSANGGRGRHAESILERLFGLPVRRRRDKRAPH